ncbi:hypothetical protein Q644_10440 [Brucella intermedia 229E]|uniref:Uncharacterized protein n=1 Tax=Brucella intermedia 229E TaxID=1337887 RepID=U4V4F2_9HYPH|nr:hypothetical protein Q644_10440 [Brucella intermedia 229E]
MLPAIRHRLDGAFRAIFAERRRGEAGVEHGRKQYLTLEIGQILIARHQGHAGSKVAARLFTGDEQHRLLVRKLRAARAHRSQDGIDYLKRRRERVETG